MMIPSILSKLCTLTVVLCLAASQQAFAHAHLKAAAPKADSIVEPPPEASADFSETLEPALSKLTVRDAHGHTVTTDQAELDPADHKRMRLPLPALEQGVYTVDWVAVSVDGHRTSGQYRFTVKWH